MKDTKLLEALNEVLCMHNLSDKTIEESKELEKSEKNVGFIDPSFVLYFKTENKRIKDFLMKSVVMNKEPTIDYTHGGTAKYSIEYLEKIINCFKSARIKSVKLSINNDQPLTAESKGLKFILAPRIENE